MKIALIALAALLVIGGGIFAYQHTRPAVVESGEAIPVGETPGIVTVTALSAEVYLTEKGSLDVVLVKRSATTTVGATIRTSATGRALVQTTGKTMVLDHDTQITIPADDNESVSKVRLLGGSVWSRVEKIFEKGEYFEIQTQNAVAAVRGTSFNVTYKDRKTTVAVEESAVAVTPLDESGTPDETKEVLVSEGKKAVREDRKDPTVSTITQQEKADGWYRFNLELKEKGVVAPPQKVETKADVKVETRLQTPESVVPKPEVSVPKPAPLAATTTPQSVPPPPPSTSGASTKNTEPLLPPGTVVLARVMPNQLGVQSTDTLTLRGLGFKHVVAVAVGQQDNNPTPVPNFEIIDDSTITFILPPNLATGTYNVVVVSDTDQGASLDKALTLF